MKNCSLSVVKSLVLSLLFFINHHVYAESTLDSAKLLTFEMSPSTQKIQFFWQDKNKKNYRSLSNLIDTIEKETTHKIAFAVNGGMYNQQKAPQGLYIENGVLLSEIDRKKTGYGNFHLQPNGVFVLDKDGIPTIKTTRDFKMHENIQYATQSGPMLVIKSAIHQKFSKASKNVNIRNGVGILPNGNLLFVMSKVKVNLFDFASFFKAKGCKNALYLDGFVSKTYLPAKDWLQTGGDFGVIIAVFE